MVFYSLFWKQGIFRIVQGVCFVPAAGSEGVPLEDGAE